MRGFFQTCLRSLWLALGIACATSLWAQGEPPAPTVERWDPLSPSSVGQQFDVTAYLRNLVAEPLTVVVRLSHTPNTAVIGADEQTVILEPSGLRPVSWRAQRTGDGQYRLGVEKYVLLDNLPKPSGIGEAERAALGKSWKGTFTDAATVFEAQMQLQPAASGAVAGQIVWTLTRHANPERARNVGKRGIEYVRGTYVQEKRELYLQGYRRDDPDHVIGLDRYRLQLDTANSHMQGITWDNGTQEGKFTLSVSN
jgi:hypothetical protein